MYVRLGTGNRSTGATNSIRFEYIKKGRVTTDRMTVFPPLVKESVVSLHGSNHLEICLPWLVELNQSMTKGVSDPLCVEEQYRFP